MVNTKFEAYKLKRELKRSGNQYEIKRYKRNVFNEPEGDAEIIGKLIGLYHEQSFYIQATTGNTQNNTTRVRSKKMPMILCLYEDVASLNLKIDDEIKINTKIFKVVAVNNIQEWNIICDISLEVVDNGIQA